MSQETIKGDSTPHSGNIGAPDIVAWMWQHEETGNVGFVDAWQVENGWQAANPRLRLIRPLVFADHQKAGWFLPMDAVNRIQADSIDQLIRRAKGAHHADVDLRINGQNEHHEADWIKHMRWVGPANAMPVPPEMPSGAPGSDQPRLSNGEAP